MVGKFIPAAVLTSGPSLCGLELRATKCVASFVAERDRWIDAHGAARGDIARDKGYTDQRQSCRDEGRRVEAAHLEQLICDYPRERRGRDKADDDAGGREAQSVT